MPARQARVKSFRDLIDDRMQSQESELTSTMKEESVSRIFVTNDVPGRHLEWIMFSCNPETFAVAAQIILTGANCLSSEKICASPPQEFTGVGSFVVDVSGFRNRHEIALDSLGSWGVPQGSSKFFKLNNSNKAVVSTSVDFMVKVYCNRYVHPGTDSRGSFIKKIYTGISRNGLPSCHAVIVYEWEGTPHPVAVDTSTIPLSDSIKERPIGSRSWECPKADLQQDEMTTYRGQPIFKKVTIDFESACRILMATFLIPENRICTRVPQQYRECGTFVLDIARCGGERAIGRDGREWNKPSGSSRFFRFDDDGNAIRVDTSLQTPGQDDFDVQIVAKRYETPQLVGLVRKIFVAREKGEPRVNSHLAVVTYLYRTPQDKGTIMNGRIVLQKKRNLSREELIVDGYSQNRIHSKDSNVCELKRLTLEKQVLNQNRLSSLLDRAEAVFDRLEQNTDSNDISYFRQVASEWGRGASSTSRQSDDNNKEKFEFVDDTLQDTGEITQRAETHFDNHQYE